MRKFRIFLLACVAAMAICGCRDKKSDVQVTEATTFASGEKYVVRMGEIVTEKPDLSAYEYLELVEIEDGLKLAVPKESAQAEGVKVWYELNPYYPEGEILFFKNLEAVVGYEFGANTEYLDVDMDFAKDISDDCASIVITYLNDPEKDIKLYDRTSYLYKLADGNVMLLNFEVCYDEETDNTEAILEELGAYYEAEIGYDYLDAEEFRDLYYEENYLAVKTIECGGLEIEIPENWEVDQSWPGDGIVYAENGEANSRGYALYINWWSDGSSPSHEQMIKNITLDKVKVYSQDVEPMGDTTFLDDMVRYSYTVPDTRGATEYLGYLGYKNNKVYAIIMLSKMRHREFSFELLDKIILENMR